MLASFFNDVVIVCTVAIVIGQHIRSDINDAIAHKKNAVITEFNKISEAGLSPDNQIAKQLDDIKAYRNSDLSVFHSLFFIVILLALTINAIRCYQEAADVGLVSIAITNAIKIILEAATIILLSIYGYCVHCMKSKFKVFNINCTSFLAGLDFVTRMNARTHSP